MFDKSDKLFANKILEIMPSLNNLRIGNPSAENVIIEFIDYNCGYCKAIHNEIISLTNDQELDLVVYFYQFPILSESSRIYSKILMAIAEQNTEEAIKLHGKIMNNKGNLNQDKLNNFLKEININQQKFEEDIVSVNIEEKLEVSYYIAKRIGGSGTPLLIINNFVEQGFLKKSEIKKLFNYK
ncbi:thioredoxin domain-containing protein [Pelagibacteraceae bacterium]|nr:thioredoxin domain-containing protein [Pelagibacteraceae bacterium]